MRISNLTISLCLLLGLAACRDDKSSREQDAAGITKDDDAGIAEGNDAGTIIKGDDGAVPGDQDAELAAGLVAKLRECEVYVDAEDGAIEDDLDRCIARCVVAATCEDIKDLSCSDEPNESTPTWRCLSKCPEEPEDGFACSDGAKIPRSYKCDGFDDCAQGEDEVGCKPYVCADGEDLGAGDLKCDGIEDCGDRSDEQGCPNICG